MYQIRSAWGLICTTIGFCVIVSTLTGCDLFVSRVDMPDFKPEEGTYPAINFKFSLDCETAGATIYYTTDGSTPSMTSPRYEEPVQLLQSATVKAIAVMADMKNSQIAEAYFDLVSERESLSGHLLYHQTRMSGVTAVNPSFWFRDELNRTQALEGVITFYDSADGSYAMTNLPNNEVGISIRYNVGGGEMIHPGNYDRWISVDLSALTDAEKAEFDITLREMIHLIAPVDNENSLTLGEYIGYSSPITFSWDPVPNATNYSYRVDEYVHSPDFSRVGTPYDDSLTATTVDIALAQNTVDAHYQFTVYAYATDSTLLGILMIRYFTGHGWDYRFKIE